MKTNKILKIDGTLLDKKQLENHLQKIASNHNLTNKPSKETYPIPQLIENYENLINEKEYDEELLGELMAYDTIYMQPNRKHCALLPVDTIKKILKEENSGANRTN